MQYVYVLDSSGTPLMPTTRYGKVRRMLQTGQAVAVCMRPFTIRLTYEPATKITQPVTLGIDPGRTNIGLAAVDDAGRCLYSAKCETRNKQIPKLMAERAMHRRASRRGERLARKRLAKKLGTTAQFLNGRMLPGYEKPVMLKDIINTESRFGNRRRPEGWLTPTAEHLLRTHLNLVEKVRRLLPVTRIAMELNRIAFMAMEDTKIKRWQYQRGPLHGYHRIQEALEDIQDSACLLCGNRSIEHDHHIVPRSRGGSDTLVNIAGLCESCHTKVHTDEDAAARLAKIKAGQNKKYHALSVLNQIMPRLLKELDKRFPGQTFITTGMDTKAFRDDHGIAKDHDTDAYCIASSTLENQTVLDIPKDSFSICQFRRHDRQLIKSQTERAYRMDGQVVAKNRRKRMDQKEPSLHEWFQAMEGRHGRQEARRLQSQLTVSKSIRRYNDLTRLLPGTVFEYQGQGYILSGQLSNGAYFRACKDSLTNYPAKQVKLLVKNSGLVYVA